MKRATILSCLCFFVSLANAQGPVAITAGVQGASVTPNFLSYPDTAINTGGSKTGFTFGFVANIPLQNGLYFHTGVLYSTKGSSWTQLYDTVNVAKSKKEQLLTSTTALDLAYIEIPLNLMYKTPARGKTRFVMGAGPQLSMLYTGESRFNTTSVSQEAPDTEVEYHYKLQSNEDLPIGHIPGRYRIVHFTANTFAGFEFGRVFFTANYSMGLNAFYQEEDRYYRHQAVGARLGIYMGKRNGPSKEK
jgi:OmpA-OmpF porin, OOP family